jgi:hypothetical protein
MEQPHNKSKLIPTPAQESSLRKLLHGNHIEREQVISIHNPIMQEQMRKLIKAKGNSEKLIGIMFSDLNHATSEMKAHPGDQFWRRTAIRTLAASLDGIIFSLKETALATGPMNGFSFDDEELFFLSEEAPETTAGKKPKLPGFRENLKRTFKLFSKIHKISCPADFNHAGFASLCETYELRHLLMHPKSYWTFAVNDEQKQKAAEGIHWLDVEIQRLLHSCDAALQNR